MKILHISTASSWRGGEQQTYFLIEGQLESGNAVHLMSPINSMLSKKCSDFDLEYLKFSKAPAGLITNIRKLSQYVKSHHIDIVHGHDSHAHTLIWLAYKFGDLNSKSVITRRLANPIKKKSIGKYNFNKIDTIICVSKAVEKALTAKIEDKDRLKVIHSGVELSRIENTRKIDFDCPITIGYVAAFSEEKDHITFISAAKMLLKDNKNLKFLLIGNGILYEEMKTLVSGYESSFEFTGFVEDVTPLYAGIDLLMHTSVAEALGTSIIDALKYSIPVVASNVGGINEIIEDRKNGLLAQANNPDSFYQLVSKILLDKELYASLSLNAISSVLKFDKSIMIDKTQNLYLKIMNSNL